LSVLRSLVSGNGIAVPGWFPRSPLGVRARRAPPSGSFRHRPSESLNPDPILPWTSHLLHSTRTSPPIAPGFSRTRLRPAGLPEVSSPSAHPARGTRLFRRGVTTSAPARRPAVSTASPTSGSSRLPDVSTRSAHGVSPFRAFSPPVSGCQVSLAPFPLAGWPPPQSQVPLAPHLVASEPRLQGFFLTGESGHPAAVV